MKKNILRKVSIGMTLGLTLLPFLALATVGGVPTEPLITTSQDITGIIFNLLSWIGGIVLAISLIMLLWAAILFLTAGASETTHSKAKSVLIYAIVGIAVALLAYSIDPLLRFIFGWH